MLRQDGYIYIQHKTVVFVVEVYPRMLRQDGYIYMYIYIIYIIYIHYISQFAIPWKNRAISDP